MWKEIDVSKMNIAFQMDDLQVTVLNANPMEFREPFPKHLHSFYELHYIFAGSSARSTVFLPRPAGQDREEGKMTPPTNQDRQMRCRIFTQIDEL